MEKKTNEYKYQKHSEKQYMFILSVAEQLFVEQGIEKVKLSDIANACGIMRSTFYRYFENKDEILWHIMRRNTIAFSQKLKERFQATNGTTFERFKTLCDILCEDFIEDTNTYLFIDLFNDTYQNATSYKDNFLYDKVYKADDFQTGDMVRFLTENFHDGSVKADLAPKTTAVALTYSAFILVAGMSRQIHTLPIKYEVDPIDVIRMSLYALLENIKA
ncbi:MAG: TetR/AcrR family transcriptional regulator [Acetanaerobacterium sp.]